MSPKARYTLATMSNSTRSTLLKAQQSWPCQIRLCCQCVPVLWRQRRRWQTVEFERAGDSRLSTNRWQISDKVESWQFVDFWLCRLSRQCVLALRDLWKLLLWCFLQDMHFYAALWSMQDETKFGTSPLFWSAAILNWKLVFTAVICDRVMARVRIKC